MRLEMVEVSQPNNRNIGLEYQLFHMNATYFSPRLALQSLEVFGFALWGF